MTPSAHIGAHSAPGAPLGVGTSRYRALGFIWLAVAGIAAGSLQDHPSPNSQLWFLLVVSCGVFVRRPVVFRCFAIAAMAFLVGRAASPPSTNPIDDLASDVPRCSVAGSIQEHAGKLGTVVAAGEINCDSQAVMRDAGSIIVDDLAEDAGSEVVLEGWLLPFSNDTWGRARARTGAEASFDATEIEVVAKPRGLLSVAASVRRSLNRSTSQVDSSKAALVRGLTIGDTSDFDPATEEEFRRTGLAHLVAVSGSNVAIVLGAVVVLVRRLRPLVRTLSCIAALAFYVVIVGPEPSVLRAAAMGAIVIAGLVWGHRAEPLHALGLALIALIALRPGLTASVGLHLSAAATAGLVLWARPLAEWLARFVPRPVAWGLGATVAAQIAVAPIMIVVFGEVSLVAPLANVLALPAVAPATVLGLGSGLVGLALPALGSIAGSTAGHLAGWVLFVADQLARPPWASVRCPPTIGWLLGAFVLSAAAVTLRSTRRSPVAEFN